MAKTSIGVRGLKDNLSATLARVRRGQTVTVTDRNRPVALIVPAQAAWRGRSRSHTGEERPALVGGRQARWPREGAARARWLGGRRRHRGSPLILYLDTSALVKLYVREVGTAQTRAHVRGAEMIATSRVAYPEARAAFARRQREAAAITTRALARAVAALDRDLDRFVVVELTATVAKRAGELGRAPQPARLRRDSSRERARGGRASRASRRRSPVMTLACARSAAYEGLPSV